MRILVDNGLQSGVGTGIDSYSRALADALASLENTEVSVESITPKGDRRLARLAYLSELDSPAYQARIADYDVVHYTNYAVPRKMPEGTVCAVTVHDLTAFSHKKTLPRAYAVYNRHIVRRAMKRADVIFTVSDTVKAEIEKRFPRAASRVVRVYPGHYESATAKITPPVYENGALMGLEKRRFFLFIGTLERRKNLTQLIKAYLALKQSCGNLSMPLVLAGRAGFGFDEIEALIRSAPEGTDIRLPGYISENDRQKLYGEAAAFIFPSIYEGFGSPQTECMASALPLLASDIPTNREVSGSFATYFPVGDVDTLTNLLRDAAKGTLTASKRQAAERLSRFTWQNAATEILAAYEAAIERKRSSKKH